MRHLGKGGREGVRADDYQTRTEPLHVDQDPVAGGCAGEVDLADRRQVRTGHRVASPCDLRVEVGESERAGDLRLSVAGTDDGQRAGGAATGEARDQDRGLAGKGRIRKRAQRRAVLWSDRLQQEGHRTSAREPSVEVGIGTGAELRDDRVRHRVRQQRLRPFDNRPFDASGGQRTEQRAVRADEHRRTELSRRRPVNVNQTHEGAGDVAVEPRTQASRNGPH